MIIKTIQIYTNRISADLQPYLTSLFQYNKKHDVTYNYDIIQVNVTGYQSVYTKIAAGYGYVITGAEKLVPQSDHDITMFIFDLAEWKTPWWNPFPLRTDTPRCDCILVNGKPFINLGYYEKDLQGFKINLLHEPMHALAKIFNCTDVMDTYIENNNPDSLTGNFAQQWKILQPYLNNTTPMNIDLKKWNLVPELELLCSKFLDLCSQKGYKLKITQGLRTMEQQQTLYNQGRGTLGKIVTNAKPGESQHNFGKAFDVAFIGTNPYPNDDKLWKGIADIGVSLGLTAGYYFKSFQDRPHFEIK